MVNRDGEIVFANTHAEVTLCLKKEQITQRTYNAPSWTITGLDGTPFPDHELPFRRVETSGKAVYNVCHAINMPDGRRSLLSINAAPLFDDEGKFDSMIATIQDITERNKAEEALEEREVLLNSVETIAKVGGWEMDMATGKATWSKGTYDIVEIDYNKPVPGLHEHVGYYLPEYREMIENKMKALEETKEPMKFEAALKTAKGNIKWCQAFGEAVVKDGKLIKLMGTFQDITERKRAEMALRESEEKFRKAFSTSPDTIAITRVSDGLCVAINKSFTQVMGYEESEIVGKSILTMNIWSNPADRQKMIEGLKAEGVIENFQTIFLTKTGMPLHALMSAALIELNGETHILNTARDITKQIKAEATLRESEVRFRELFNNMSSAVAVYQATDDGEDFIFTDFNASAEKLEKVDRASVIGKSVRQVFPGVMEFGLFTVLQRVWHTGRPESHPISLYKDEKISGWRENYVYKLPSGDIVAVYDDVTERKQTEDAIIKSKLLLQLVIDSTPDWIYVKDFQHRFLLVNKSFADAQNIASQDMIGRADTDFFDVELCLGNPDKGIVGFHADDEQAFHGHMVHSPKNIISGADGSQHVYDTYKIPLTDQSGKIYGALVYSRDFTARQKAEDERESALEAVQKTMTSMISTMSKIVEMRDPYTSGHQQRVADLSDAIAREMNFDNSQIEYLVMAAKVHDIGKMYVPSDILSKPGKLSTMELNLIKTHAQGSFDILQDIEFARPVALMALQHHERLDGSGYPNGLKSEEILIEAKILAVADVVEAMSSYRPYRPALGVDKALDEISRNKGILYDVDVVDTCLKLFNEQRFKFNDVNR